jgi:hypothetical protein
MADGIQRTCRGGWDPTDISCGCDPSAQSGNGKSEQVKQRMDLEHCLHWLRLEPAHLLYYTGYT